MSRGGEGGTTYRFIPNDNSDRSGGPERCEECLPAGPDELAEGGTYHRHGLPPPFFMAW